MDNHKPNKAETKFVIERETLTKADTQMVITRGKMDSFNILVPENRGYFGSNANLSFLIHSIDRQVSR